MELDRDARSRRLGGSRGVLFHLGDAPGGSDPWVETRIRARGRRNWDQMGKVGAPYRAIGTQYRRRARKWGGADWGRRGRVSVRWGARRTAERTGPTERAVCRPFVSLWRFLAGAPSLGRRGVFGRGRGPGDTSAAKSPPRAGNITTGVNVAAGAGAPRGSPKRI